MRKVVAAIITTMLVIGCSGDSDRNRNREKEIEQLQERINALDDRSTALDEKLKKAKEQAATQVGP